MVFSPSPNMISTWVRLCRCFFTKTSFVRTSFPEANNSNTLTHSSDCDRSQWWKLNRPAGLRTDEWSSLVTCRTCTIDSTGQWQNRTLSTDRTSRAGPNHSNPRRVSIGIRELRKINANAVKRKPTRRTHCPARSICAHTECRDTFSLVRRISNVIFSFGPDPNGGSSSFSFWSMSPEGVIHPENEEEDAKRVNVSQVNNN